MTEPNRDPHYWRWSAIRFVLVVLVVGYLGARDAPLWFHLVWVPVVASGWVTAAVVIRRWKRLH
jgi:hypothetical protein